MSKPFKPPVIDRISIVLRPAEGQTLEQIAQYVQLGAPVAIGRAGAVISACADRDVIEELHQVGAQLVVAESAMRRGVVLNDDYPTAEKSSVVAETPYAEVRVTNIDEWITTVRNAQRYEWLRDKARVDDMDTDLCAAREEQCFFGSELDVEIDNAFCLAGLLKVHGEPV